MCNIVFLLSLDSFTLSFCSHLCSSYNHCQSAVYDWETNQCYLYNFTDKVVSSSRKTMIIKNNVPDSKVS